MQMAMQIRISTKFISIDRAGIYLLSFFCFLGFYWGGNAFSGEFTRENEKLFGLRSIGRLQITNPRGDIIVQGSSADRIRMKFKKRVIAESEAKAALLFESINYRYEVLGKDIQITAEYGNGLDLLDRLHEQEHPSAHADIVILAPPNLKLSVWSVNGKVSLKSWNASAQIRAGSGVVRVEGVKAEQLEVDCPTCSVQMRNIRASVRCVSGSGELDLAHVYGKRIYVGTDTGGIKLFQIQGEQLYSSKSGMMDGQSLKGKIGFSSQHGNVAFRDVWGGVSGAAEFGKITARIKKWEFPEKAFIEAGQGGIDLGLPASFSGDVDIWSLHGKTAVDFFIEKSVEKPIYGPEPANHLVGRIGDGGELLKVYSENGDIRISKESL